MKIPIWLSVTFVALWSFAYPLSALGISAMSPMLLLTIRFTASALALAAIVTVTRRPWPRG